MEPQHVRRILLRPEEAGVALGIFYLLLRRFNFEFATIGSTAAEIIAVLFLLIVGTVTFYAIHRWAPQRNSAQSSLLTSTTGALDALHELDNAIRTTVRPCRL